MKKLVSILISVTMVLSISSAAFANSIQPRYSNTGYVFGCVGSGESDDEDDEINTLQECGTVCDYINKWGLFGEIYINPGLSEFQDGRLNSPIIYFAGHGNYDSINTGGTTGISDGSKSGYKNIRNVDFDETKIAVLSGCYTASIPGNITERININGADFSLGWKESYDNEHSRRFSAAFFKHLDQQRSCFDALYYATDELLTGKDGESPIWNDADIFDFAYYGDGDLTISSFLSTYSNYIDDSYDRYAPLYHDDLIQYEVDGDVNYYYGSEDYDSLESYFRDNIDENFNISDYSCEDMEAFKNGDLNILTLRYKVGNIDSDFGYNVMTDNGKVFLITQVGTDITSENIVSPLTTMSDNEIKEMSKEYFDETCPLYKQNFKKIFNSEEMKIQYYVTNIYGDEETGYFAKTFEYSL